MTLSTTQSITFTGTIEPDPTFGVENPLGRAGCDFMLPCETIKFTAAETGQATLRLVSDNPNNILDVAVECGTMGIETPRGFGSTDPVTGEAVVVFTVTAGETCTVFITVFVAEDVFAPVPFHGTITLNGVVPTGQTEAGFVSGGGQAMTLLKSPFTTNAKEKSNGKVEGNVKYFVFDELGNSCKFHANDITSVEKVDNTATITGMGRLNTGSGWSEPIHPFAARVVDVDDNGTMDQFQINQCGGNADGDEIRNGNITVRSAPPNA